MPRGDAFHQQATSHRGAPRNAVAVISRAAGAASAHESENPYFTGDSSDPPSSAVSWHSRCDRAVTMKNATDLMTNAESQPVLGSDWVDAHADYLFNFAIGQVRNANTAEDLVQDTFLAAVKAQNSFGGKSSARTRLVGILRHKIYDHLRKTCRERAVRHDPTPTTDGASWEESALWLHDVAAETQLPSRRIELDEFRANLELALGKLPSRIAQVFQLYQIEERPNREVCQQLNISESNLWVMLHRARKQLREHLNGWWQGETRNPKLEIRNKSEIQHSKSRRQETQDAIAMRGLQQ